MKVSFERARLLSISILAYIYMSLDDQALRFSLAGLICEKTVLLWSIRFVVGKVDSKSKERYFTRIDV